MYVLEVWNPPEARVGAARPKPSVNKEKRHRRVSMALAQTKARRRVATRIVASRKVHTASTETRASQRSFDDIPKQMTPEGNVLRVKGRQAQVAVER